MIRKIRITLACISFVLVTLLFLDFTGTLHGWFGWLAKIQLMPALLAVNVGVVAALAALTLLFGRIYCSVVCPLGIFQDVVSRIAGRRKKNRFSYSPSLAWLRYAVLAIFAIAFAAGVSSAVALLEPYSAYGRMASNLLAPLYQWGNNALDYLSGRVGSYAFYPVEVWLKGGLTLAIAAGFFALLAILAWRNGRTYCNSICPVGTALGFAARFSLFKPVIDAEKCNGCGLCARNCKASCIDHKRHRVDYSRCVTCLDCMGKCRQKALAYAIPKCPSRAGREKTEADGSSRRGFLSIAALFAFHSALKAQQAAADGGLATIEAKKIPLRETSLVPAGAQGLRHLAKHCTACQLCVAVCPNQVLRPSSGWAKLMQPEMSFERGYCRPECVKCSEVCPTAAIKRITREEKTAVQIGHAVWIKANCVVVRDEVTCRSCERHCPTGAIQLVPQDAGNPRSLKLPAIDTERCIGCGACENRCPARPFSAIYIEGHERHRSI
ncbi:MAG: 4Fe-4S binding protein [Prevotellaceae bacterium]|nr:4Fe-4S binding protein [Prevotellaceae bacterium]